jgi:predicted nuclease with TOPRIM domain
MITKKAVGLANEIIEAQSKAFQTGLAEGVFICVDSKKGLYEFIKPENLILNNATLLSQINTLNTEVSQLKDEIEILKAANKLLQEKNVKTDEALEMLKAAVLELNEKVEEEGNIL